MRWFEREPARLQRELDALTDAGLSYVVNEEERAKGRIILDVTRSIEGAEHTFAVVYPYQFPYFAFAVLAPASLTLSRHINPYERNLCLLADVQQLWRDTDTAADFLTTQLDRLIEANRNPGGSSDVEAHDAELITGHLIYFPDSLLFTINAEIPKENDRGFLDIASESDDTKTERAFRGAMLAVRDSTKKILAELPAQFASRYQKSKKFPARWIRLSAPPKSGASERILDEAIDLWPELSQPTYAGGPDIVALYVPEQTGYRTEGSAWIPVIRHKFGRGRDTKVMRYLLRPNRAELVDFQARNARLRPLHEKTVLLVGLGALGSIIAWQLARAGVGSLRLIDRDVVETGNTPRWLLGVHAVGYSKARSIANYLVQSFPYLTIEPSHVHGFGFGDPNLDSARNEALLASLDGADLIVDGSAEWTANDYLSTEARRRGIPYVWASATPGARGGVVGRAVPDRKTGCWSCFQWALNDGTIAAPPEEKDAFVQPLGCALPTFTGAAFDLDEISTEAARLVVSTLLRGTPGHQDVDWDVAVCAMWDRAADMPTVPTWITYDLAPDPRCVCN
jgi:molybdopterin/thiamine biosynthesis adenylyltransferase